MQRLKLYNIPEIQQSEKESDPCCLYNLESNDDHLELVDSCFSEASNINEEERSTLYYISGYVAYKEGLGISGPEREFDVVSEFLKNVSRGKLSYPPQDLYDLSLYYYTFFKAMPTKRKCCDKIFLQAYKLIYEYTDYDFSNIEGINRRFSNTFFKAFVKKETDLLKRSKNEKQLKKRKLNCSE